MLFVLKCFSKHFSHYLEGLCSGGIFWNHYIRLELGSERKWRPAYTKPRKRMLSVGWPYGWRKEVSTIFGDHVVLKRDDKCSVFWTGKTEVSFNDHMLMRRGFARCLWCLLRLNPESNHILNSNCEYMNITGNFRPPILTFDWTKISIQIFNDVTVIFLLWDVILASPTRVQMAQ
jgi:hypothetical protein